MDGPLVRLYEIEVPAPGRLATMPHPPGGAVLPAAMAALAAAGVALLVSAQEASEVAELDLGGQDEAATGAGLSLIRFPIPDRGVPAPDRLPAVRALADRLAAEVRKGRYVATHCWAGIGRSSMLAGAVLVGLGVAPPRAWERIQAARGFPVPDSRAQEAWLYRYADHRAATAEA